MIFAELLALAVHDKVTDVVFVAVATRLVGGFEVVVAETSAEYPDTPPAVLAVKT